MPDGKIIRPSRFIDAAKKGQDDLLQEFRNDPTKNIGKKNIIIVFVFNCGIE